MFTIMAHVDVCSWLVRAAKSPLFAKLVVQTYIAEASIMTGSLDGSHDVIKKAHAVLRSGIKAAHLPVIESCPRAGYGMPCLPQADLQEGVPTCPVKP